ncbi:helix-turn-helix domain-containing protein [Kocuria rosea]|uniref:helix-turn-helix domain-containing protein n=1 Tax=Kocuria rosea TaxID=1275 RepID=UPI002541CB18|nr:helix-turn-helix domain-containing protein [Kocuria rosea]WIG18394.1 helix-turn-helix domain-containing protein [Kocuria rosea]
MSPPDVEDEFLDEAALAIWLNKSPRSLQRWRRSAHGPAFVRVGKSIRYRRSDVERWLEEQTVRPGAVA